VGYEAGEETFKSWASLDGCTGEPERTSHGDSFCDTYTSCEGGVEVSFCTVDPMAHCWPGGDRDMCEDFFGPYSDDIDAGRHMWDFMSRFVLD